jgi:hypothetical protein
MIINCIKEPVPGWIDSPAAVATIGFTMGMGY